MGELTPRDLPGRRQREGPWVHALIALAILALLGGLFVLGQLLRF